MTDLKHVGILGMKWGRRKSSSSSSTSSVDHASASTLKKKKLNEMSNEELKKLTTRMQLEKQFKDLSKRDVSIGQKFVTDVATNFLKQEAVGFLTTFSKTIASNVLKAIKDRVDKANG